MCFHVAGQSHRPTRLGALLPILLAALLAAAPARAEMGEGLRLLMLDEKYCEWCELWDEEVGVVYDRTDEGRRAPLARQDIDDPLPVGVTLTSRPRYTPTFVLLCNGQETGRITGYPGEDFFWGLLGRLLRELDDSHLGNVEHDPAADCAVKS